MQSLDPHQRPPDSYRKVYKHYQKLKPQDLDADPNIIDIEKHRSEESEDTNALRVVDTLDGQRLTAAYQTFAGADFAPPTEPLSPVPVYEHRDLPGLHLLPSFLPPQTQSLLLSQLLHRDLSNPTHKTNIHTHHTISYPSPPGTSLFSLPATATADTDIAIAHPLNPALHTPLSTTRLLSKKLRWLTLGGQYNWTRKQYPDASSTPPFPNDIKHLLETVFPGTRAEAAIVNLYSPGDTLSLHRDVAEECANGLVSVSLGCDALFVVGLSSDADAENVDGPLPLTMRLRSGSAVYMSGKARYAWHGVPQIVAGTCPEYLRRWPAGTVEGGFEEWDGWMGGKRVNLNVRQMWD